MDKLEGVVVASMIISTQTQKTIALGTAWQPSFNCKAFDSKRAKMYWDNLGDIGEYEDEFAPSYWNFRDAIGRGPTPPVWT